MTALSKQDIEKFVELRGRTINIFSELEREMFEELCSLGQGQYAKVWFVTFSPYETGPEGKRHNETTKWRMDRFATETDIAIVFRCLMPMFEFLHAKEGKSGGCARISTPAKVVA